MAELKEQHTSSMQQSANELDYNTTRTHLKLPEYGRLVQHMVDYAVTIENKDERQKYAEAIANVMIGLNPKMKDVTDFQNKIWDHLAYMADYKLDIDYPSKFTEMMVKECRLQNYHIPKEIFVSATMAD